MEVAIPIPDLIRQMEKRLRTEFALLAEDWSRCISALTQWEDAHLLDNPTPDLLAAHKTAIQRLLEFGRLISSTTEQTAFPDPSTAEIVAATHLVLRDKLRMWHEPRMSLEESNRILTACFPDES